MLEVKSLSATYGQHPALRDVSLRVTPGEIVVILGANGAGKSSLLKAVSGICEGRTEGSVTLRGTEILGLPPNRIVEEGIALVPEGRGVFGDLTVAENLTLGAYAPRARDEEAASLERVLGLFPKLSERHAQVVRTMSGGEQQMVAIGRAMMSNPVFLTLDEPSLGLSPLLCKELFQSLVAVKKAGIGILLVEQNARQSLAIADRAYLLENGRIVHHGAAAELRNDPAVQAAYLGGSGATKGRAGAGGGATGGPRPAAPPPPPAVAAQSPPQRPAGQAPDAIAAAALASLAPPQRPAPALTTTVAPAPLSALAPPQASRPPRPVPPSPQAPARMPEDALLGGQSLADLVARAAAESRARHGATSPAAPPAATARPLPAFTAPAHTAPQDRLKSVLSEIEEAAARARTWRPDPHRK